MKEKASFREKISYAFCGVSYDFEVTILMSYFLFFCTDCMHINVAVLGIVMAAVKILDAITDVLVLNLADRINTKWGRYRPLMLMSGPFLILCFVLIFWNPGFLATESAKILWVCILYVLLVPIFETMYLCPLQVMGSVMSPLEKDRLDFAAFRTVGENLSEIILSASCMTLVLAFGGYGDTHSWRVTILIYAAIMLFALIVGVSGTKERIQVSTKKADGSDLKFLDKMKILKGKKPLFRALISLFGLFFSWTVSIAFFSYYCVYVCGHEEWVALLSTIGIVVQLVVSILVGRLARKADKRYLIVFGGLILILSGALLLAGNGFGILLAYQVLRGIGIGLQYVCLWALWPDLSDYIRAKTGLMVPGVIIAAVSIIMKVSQSVSSFLVTVLLNAGGYDGTLAVQSNYTLTFIKFGMIAGLVIGGALSIIGMSGTKEISRKAMDSYRKNEVITG